MKTMWERYKMLRESQEETPAQAFARMRALTPGLGDSKPVATYRPGSEPAASPSMTAGAQQKGGLPPAITDLLQAGFRDGGIVSPQLMRQLGITSPDHHLVGPDLLTATAQGPYPFVKEKMAGRPTGRIRFVRHFPIDKFLRIWSEK